MPSKNGTMDEDDWLPRPPKPITAANATNGQSLRGRRAIIGHPSTGWRADLRADDPVIHKGQPHVPVLPELDYYRAEIEDREIFAPLIPIDKVWIETETDERTTDETGPPPNSLLARLTDNQTPPTRHPVPARDAPRVLGARLALVSPIGVRRDLRAITEPFQNTGGDIVVNVAPEIEWYQWIMTGREPTSTEAPIYLIWLE